MFKNVYRLSTDMLAPAVTYGVLSMDFSGNADQIKWTELHL